MLYTAEVEAGAACELAGMLDSERDLPYDDLARDGEINVQDQPDLDTQRSCIFTHPR